ncbi:MAG: ATP-binding protein [Mariprofundus sp.]
MKRWFTWAKERLQNRPDSEHEQALLRILIAALICIYFYYSGPNLALYLSLLYLPVALGMLLGIIYAPAANHFRRLGAITADIGMISLGVMLSSGETGVIFVALYLWVITGNGFRFGIKYLLYATMLSLGAFILIMKFSPYWHQHIPLVIGQLIVIAVVPLFMARLIRKLHHAIDASEAANRAKTHFIANMSHELRTPLNGIIGMNDLALSTRLNKEQQRFAFVIRESAYHLLSLIERILDMSKLEAGKLELAHEAFDLHQLLHAVMALFEGQASEKGIRIGLQCDPEVPFTLLGDPKHIKQILLNIIGNAVKFTEQGYVVVSVDPIKIGAQQVILKFTVSDTGIGMSDTAQSRIFEQFTQADASITRRFGGTGLGTTIAKNMTELMGGTIHLESSEGTGSKFFIELPLDRSIDDISGERSLSQLHVLMLADNVASKQTQIMLKRWGVNHTLIEDDSLLLSELLDAYSLGQSYDVVVIEKASLRYQPERIAAAIRNKRDMDALDMILIKSAQDRSNDHLMVSAGYTAVLHPPLQESLLFNALHAASGAHHATDITSIADALQKKQVMKPLQILLAEDNPINQEVLQAMLQKIGHEVYLAQDGEQALDALAGEMTFDLVLLDMNMPKASGLDVLRQFRFMDTSAKTPVMILSADAMPETISECMDAGANDYITKPVQFSSFLNKIAALTNSTEQPANATDPESKQDKLLNEGTLDELFNLIRSPEKQKHLLHSFESSGNEHLKKLLICAQQGDKIKFLERIHTLKGSAGTLGVQNVLERCRQIETTDDLNPINMLRHTKQLHSDFQAGCTALHAYLKRYNP